MNDDTTVKVKIVANDESKAAVEEAKGRFAGLWKEVAGGILAANVVQYAWQGMRTAFDTVKDAAEDWQNQQSALNAALASTHDVSGVSSQDAIDYAEALQKSTPISRDAALAGENMILTFTNIHKNVFPQTTQAIADMATAMNHGLTPNAQTLTTTAIMVGKALNDPATGLTKLQRVGVSFTAQQKEQIKTMVAAGNTAGAQKIILEELSKEFGGRAAAAAQTFQGRVQQLKNQLIDLGVSALQKVMSDLAELYTWYEKHQRIINDVASVVVALGGAILTIITIYKIWEGTIKLVTLAQEAMNLVFETNPIVLAITAIIAIGLLLIMHWKQVKQVAMDVWHSIIDFIHSIPSGIKSAIGDLSNLLVDVGKSIIRGMINGIKSEIHDASQAVKDVANTAVSGVKNLLGIHSPSAVFADIGENMGKGLIQGLQNIKAQASIATTQLVTGVPSAGATMPTSSSVTNNNSYGGNRATVTIQQLVLSSPAAVTKFFDSINQDTLNSSSGLSVIQGRY